MTHTRRAHRAPAAWSRRTLLRTAAGGALTAAAPILAGCASSASADPGTVVEWNGWSGGDGVKAMKKLVAGFPGERYGFDVSSTTYQWDTLFAKLPVAVQAGRAPDTVIAHVTELAQFADLGVFEPLDGLIEDAGIDLTGVNRSALESCRYRGRTYAVPGDVHCLAMFYNTRHLETAGLDPGQSPGSREEFVEWAERLRADVPSSQMAAPLFVPYLNAAQGRWFWWSLLHQFGGSFFNDDATRCTVADPEGVESLQFLMDLYRRGLATGAGGAQSPEASGRIGMWPIGPWVVPQYLRAELPFSVSELPPVGGRRATWANQHCMTLVTGRRGVKRERTLAYVKWFYDNYAEPGVTIGHIPPSPKARRNPVFTSSDAYPYYRVFIEAAEHAVIEPTIPQYTDIFSFSKPTPLTVHLTEALQGKASAPAALRSMQDEINTLLANG